MMGTTPLTVYIESASGIEDGGRTGVTGGWAGAARRVLPPQGLGPRVEPAASPGGRGQRAASMPALLVCRAAGPAAPDWYTEASPLSGCPGLSCLCQDAELRCAALPFCNANTPWPSPPPTRPLLAAIVVSFFFFLTLFFSPIIASIPPYATGPALVLVGESRRSVVGSVCMLVRAALLGGMPGRAAARS